MKLRKSGALGLGAMAAWLGVGLCAVDQTGAQEGVKHGEQAGAKALANVIVHIRNFAYDPETVEIRVGDSVTWINDDAAPHTATRTSDPAFDTGLLAKDESKTIQFTHLSGGSGIEYFCGPHPFMKGHVVVRPPGIHLAKGDADGARKGDDQRKKVSVRAPTNVPVRIHNFAYDPPVVEIQVGDSVTWANEDAAPHTATRSDTPSPFDTGYLNQGQSNSHTFTEPSDGTGFRYICTPHPFMEGRVVVKLPGSHLGRMGHDDKDGKASK